MKKDKQNLLLILIVLSSLIMGRAQATLIGQEIDITAFGTAFSGNVSLNETVTVSAIVPELTGTNGSAPPLNTQNAILPDDVIDISSDSINLLWSEGSFGAAGTSFIFRFDGLIWRDDPGARITSFLLDTDVAGFDASRVTIFDNAIEMDWGGLQIDLTGRFAALTLQTSHSVPEPAVFGLICLGLAGFGFTHRRKTQNNAYLAIRR